jgi:hypothetical protein
MLKLVSLLVVLTGCQISLSQEQNTIDFTHEIKLYDVSTLWTTEFILEGSDTSKIRKMPVIGFIGDNFQRFYIHFVSVIKNPENKLVYCVYGKTKVKNQVCAFQGTITITSAQIFKEGDSPDFKQGILFGKYEFFENPDSKSSGILKGNFQSNFLINKQKQIRYDALSLGADGFKNNQFEGTWTSYKTASSKICNWGDYRIPASADLDAGTAEFYPKESYLNFDWNTYKLAFSYVELTKEKSEALEKEFKKWWLED